VKSAQLELGLDTIGSGSFVQSAMPPPVSMATTPERSSSVEISERHEMASAKHSEYEVLQTFYFFPDLMSRVLQVKDCNN